MIYPSMQNYDLNPCINISNNNGDVVVGNHKLIELIKSQIDHGNKFFVFDLYPGVDKESLISLLKGINYKLLIETDTCKLPESDLHYMFDQNITDDRVFAYMVNSRLENCFNMNEVANVKSNIEKHKDEVIFIVGVGASIFAKWDIHYYFDFTRWEIQLRFRSGGSNWMFDNSEAPNLTKYKIGFFLEWRLADTHKHDHILIPAGTIHCSGNDTMVLEISATPYIFTFKLWDWGQIGLDGLPRPVHINHGKENIAWDRNTDWVMDNLFHREEVIQKDDHCLVERTGLHELEFIDTIRYSFHEKAEISLNDSVAALNLVEGKEAFIKSIDGSWEPKKIHYGETFIVPASVGEFTIESYEGKKAGVIVATVR